MLFPQSFSSSSIIAIWLLKKYFSFAMNATSDPGLLLLSDSLQYSTAILKQVHSVLSHGRLSFKRQADNVEAFSLVLQEFEAGRRRRVLAMTETVRQCLRIGQDAVDQIAASARELEVGKAQSELWPVLIYP